jgi:Leucine-rich repeat (LRR) protein
MNPQMHNPQYIRALEMIARADKTGANQLSLEGLSLTTIPPEIGKLKYLTKLTLWNNHLTTLPPEICNLTNLKELWLWSNQLSSLPPEIGNLVNLVDLDLSNNKLTILPAEIGKLENLSKLNISNNKLTHLPIEMGKLTNLQTLHLINNPLQFPPTGITNKGRSSIISFLAFQINNKEPQIGEKYTVVEKVPQPLEPEQIIGEVKNNPDSCVTLTVPNYVEPDTISEITVQLKNNTKNKIENVFLDSSDMNEFFSVDGEVKVSFIKSGMELDYIIKIKPKIQSGTIPIIIKVSVGGKIIEKEYIIKVGGTEMY